MASIKKRGNKFCVIYHYNDSEGKRRQKSHICTKTSSSLASADVCSFSNIFKCHRLRIVFINIGQHLLKSNLIIDLNTCCLCGIFRMLRDGVKINLYYNRTFSRKEFKTTKYEGSYSRPFRPDYTLAIFPISFGKGKYNGEEEAIANGAVSYIHFDAKYRISDLTSLIGNNKESELDEAELVDDKIESVVNTYKRGDLLM